MALGTLEEPTSLTRRSQAALSERTASHRHTVCFYEDEARLVALVTDFAREAALARQPVVVIARGGLRASLAARLQTLEECRDLELAMFDARALLGVFMLQGAPDPARFDAALAPLFGTTDAAGSLRATPRVYGEMVDVLCEDGNASGALQLEALWNDFVSRRSVSLLCAYRMARFATEGDAEAFAAVCRAHGRVVPAGLEAVHDADHTLLSEMAVLQQRANALQGEVDRRRASEASLAQSRAAHDSFLRVAGHELRTPLTVVQLQVQHLLRSADAELPKRVQRALELTVRGVDRLALVVEQVLDVARIEEGSLFLHLCPVDFAALVRQVIERLPALARGEVVLNLQLQDRVLGRWDLSRMERVVMTLLSNALKFGRGLAIDVTLVQVGPVARLSVRDRGEGLEPQHLARIFERDSRGDAALGLGGLGLSLWIAKAAVGAHGGSITAESAPGDGVTFTVELPLAAA